MTPKGFLKGIDVRGFLDTGEEWHAFVIGFCEVICPWPAFRKRVSRKLSTLLKDEYHYYMWGRAVAILAWVAISCAIKGVFS